MKTQIRLALALFGLTSVSSLLTGCGGGNAAPAPAISISLTPNAAQSIDQGQTVTVNAVLANDSSNQGVSWSLSGLGTLSNSTSSSVKFNAPTSGSTNVTDTVTATSKADTTRTASLKITVALRPTITTTSSGLPAGTAGVVYNAAINWTGGTSPFNGAVIGSLPAGVASTCTAAQISSTCTLSGTPTTQGTFGFTLSVTDATGVSVNQALTINIGPPLPLNIITTSPLPYGNLGLPYLSPLQAVGGVPPFTWSLAAMSNSVPAGLSLSNVGIGGTPTAVGTSTFSLVVSDAETPAQTASATFSLTIHTVFFGQHTFLFNGFAANGAVATAGSFTADDTGNVTGGVEDVNRHVPGPATNISITGSYVIGSANRGTFTLTDPQGTSTFEVDLNSRRFIEFDSSGTRGSGIIRHHTPSTCALNSINGDFAFGGAGEDASNSRVAIAGRFHADGAGNFSGGALDENDAATLASNVSWTGTYAAPAGSSPRCSATFTPASLPVLNFAMYPVSPTEVFLVEVDQAASKVPVMTSRVLAQDVTAIGAVTTLLGVSAGGLTGSLPGTNAPVAKLVYLNSDGTGNATLTSYENQSGVLTSTWNQGRCNVSPNGRTTLTTGANPPVLYLENSGAFAVGTDNTATFGHLVGNPPTDYGPTNATLSGGFTLATDAPASASVTDLSGIATFDGAGTLAATWDASGQTGNVTNQAFTGTYSVTNYPVDGHGTLTLTPAGGSPANFIFLMLFRTKCVHEGYGGPTICSPTSAFEVVAIPSDATQTNPAVLIFEQ